MGYSKLNEEQEKIKQSIQEMNDENYMRKVKSDLQYESGTLEDDDFHNGDVQKLMYLRKNVNRVVNPVILSSYASNLIAKEEKYKYLQEEVNKAIDDIVDSEKGREAATVGFRTCVISGIGYITINTDYISQNSMAQKVIVNKVLNPCTIMIDKLSSEVDGSDADKGCIINWIDKQKAKSLYGEDIGCNEWSESMYSGLIKPVQDTVPELTYFYKDYKSVRRYFMEDDNFIDSSIEEEYDFSDQKEQPIGDRIIETTVIKCCKYVGQKKVYETEFNMDYIPIVPIKGDITYEGDELKAESRGLVYLGKPGNEVANYYHKRELEKAKTAPLPPYIVEISALPEGAVKNVWSNMHKNAYNFLPWDSNNGKAPMPQRNDTTPDFQAEMAGRQKAEQDIKEIIGLPDVNFGDAGTGESGRSVFLRQKQGELATIHYQKNLERSIKQVVKIVIDLLGQVDTSKKTFKKEVPVFDPTSGQMIMQKQEVISSFVDEEINHNMFNISLAQGPMYESRKQESMYMLFEAANNQNLWPILDLLIEDSDIPNAEKISERIKKLMPPELQEESPIPPQAQEIINQMQQDIEQYKAQSDQQLQMYNELADYTKQLQMKLISDQDKIIADYQKAEMQKRYDLALTEMKINADYQKALLTANTNITKENIKQDNENIRTTQEIIADAEKDSNKIQSELTKSMIDLQKTEFESRPQTLVENTNVDIRPVSSNIRAIDNMEPIDINE